MEVQNKKKQWSLPPIGMRIIKSAVGVFLCYLVDIFRNGQGIVFYSQLAVLWCMQEYKKDTLAQAKQRILGTFVGAGFGLVILAFWPKDIPGNQIGEKLFEAMVISLFIMVILYFTVVIEKRNASYFSCVVFLSIVVNHISDLNPFLFVWNRILDTLIGILLGVLVNSFSLPRQRRNEILFVSGVDDTLLSAQDNLTPYSRYELNRMIDAGAKFTVSTMRTPASLMESLKGISLKLPAIVMDGAALYDMQKNSYLFEYVISNHVSERIISFLQDHHCNYFANVIVDDLLMIYYQETEKEGYNRLLAKYRTSPYRNYIRRPLPKGERVAYFMMFDYKEELQAVYDALQKQEIFSELKVLFYDSADYPGYAYIKIYNHNATRTNMLEYLKAMVQTEEVITFGTIEGKSTYLIRPGDSNRVVKWMKKEYEPLKHYRKKRGFNGWK